MWLPEGLGSIQSTNLVLVIRVPRPVLDSLFCTIGPPNLSLLLHLTSATQSSWRPVVLSQPPVGERMAHLCSAWVMFVFLGLFLLILRQVFDRESTLSLWTFRPGFSVHIGASGYVLRSWLDDWKRYLFLSATQL